MDRVEDINNINPPPWAAWWTLTTLTLAPWEAGRPLLTVIHLREAGRLYSHRYTHLREAGRLSSPILHTLGGWEALFPPWYTLREAGRLSSHHGYTLGKQGGYLPTMVHPREAGRLPTTMVHPREAGRRIYTMVHPWEAGRRIYTRVYLRVGICLYASLLPCL